MSSDLERELNSIRADVTVLQLIIQAQLVRLGEVRPEGYQEIRDAVFRGADQYGIDAPPSLEGKERMHQLTIERTKDFFRDVERLLRSLSPTEPPSRAN